jgi:hypothetical protein
MKQGMKKAVGLTALFAPRRAANRHANFIRVLTGKQYKAIIRALMQINMGRNAWNIQNWEKPA